MRFIKTISIVFMILSITSCARLYRDNSYIIDRDSAYMNAKALPPLNIPPGLDSSSIKSEYPIAENQYTTNTKNVSLTPPELYPAK